MADRNVGVADETHLAASQDRTDQPPGGESCRERQECNLQPQLPCGVACEQALCLQHVGCDEEHDEYEGAAQVDRLGGRQSLELVAKALRCLVHDAVGEAGR